MSLFKTEIKTIDQKIIAWIRVDYPDIKFLCSQTVDDIKRFSFNLWGYDVQLDACQIGDFYVVGYTIMVSINDLKWVYTKPMKLSDMKFVYIMEKSIEHYKDKMNKIRLSEINEEDIKFIFQDLLDLDNVKEIKWDGTSIKLKFIPEYVDGRPNGYNTHCKSYEFTNLFKKSISQLESLYDVSVFTGLSNSPAKEWELKLKYNSL